LKDSSVDCTQERQHENLHARHVTIDDVSTFSLQQISQVAVEEDEREEEGDGDE